MGRGEGCAIPKTEKFECMKSRAIPKPEKFLIPKSEKFDCSIGEGCAIPKSEKFECIEECVEGFAIPKPEKFECIGEGCAIPKAEKFVCQECTKLRVIRKELDDERLKGIPSLEKLLEILNQIYQLHKNHLIRISNRYKKIENQQKFEPEKFLIPKSEKFECIGEGCAIPKPEKFECVGEGCTIPKSEKFECIGEGFAIPNSEKFKCIEELKKIGRSDDVEIRHLANMKQFDDRLLEILNLVKQLVELDKIKKARKRKGVEVPERLSSKRVKPEE